MKVARCALFVVVLFVVSSRQFVNGFIDPFTIGTVISAGIRLNNAIISITSGSGNDVGQLMDQISALWHRIDSFQQNFLAGNVMGFLNLPRQLLTETLIADHLRDLNEQLDKISWKYDLLKEYSDPKSGYENVTINNFARDCISSVGGVAGTIEKIHNLVVPRKDGFDNRNLLKLLADRSRNKMGGNCSDTESHQHLLYRLYNVLAVAEIKGFSLLEFSYMLRRLYGHGNFTSELYQTQNRYQIRFNETLDAFRSEMSTASPDLWTCDPPHPIGKDSYAELVNFMRAYVAPEWELTTSDSCDISCSKYDDRKHHPWGNSRDDMTDDRHRPCSGRMYDCTYFDYGMTVCLDPKGGTYGHPLYEHITLKNGRVLGKKQKSCDSSRSVYVAFWYNWESIFSVTKCDYCICKCAESAAISDVRFDMREVVADTRSNKVVTGIRIVKKQGLVRLEIEQGKLLGKGAIANTTEWMNSNPRESNLREGVDFARLTYHERRFDLDDLTAPPGHCLTGVRLRKKNSHLRVEIMTTPFDFTTGMLMDPLRRSQWHGNDDTTPKTRVELKDPDRSTLSPLPSIPNFGRNQYVEFGITDMDKDAGQSIVPFIDTQPILPNPRVILTGCGIYHRGTKGYGGYIAPKLKAYDYAPYLRTDRSISD